MEEVIYKLYNYMSPIYELYRIQDLLEISCLLKPNGMKFQ